ncbi:peptidoglycan DD-metalloendopeptidase family protein [Gemmobacter serpentinus]|uniref:peptidoglycan DD-metalloendopeptidase family protein n=1 Tax=Gemmobacter serpentinus TaxID=2652247 RepID=UPI00124D5F3A|nr:peptidoglycan DD-metalloendopeptidase family protein [Gemmobacter serpentinus]
MDIQRIAASLEGQDDLYAALRRAGTGLSPRAAEDLLPALYAALGAAPEAARLASVDQGLLRAVIRAGAGLPAAPALADFLRKSEVAPVFLPEIGDSLHMPLLCDVTEDMPAYSDLGFDLWFADQGVDYGLGPYGEKRSVYRAAQFADQASSERRMIHMGIDVFAPAGTEVHAPLPGLVHSVVYNADPLDYGHTLILRHDGPGADFFTLYGHLGATLTGLCKVGQAVAAGQVIAHLGDWPENGGWAPHLHFQVMADLLEQRDGNFFGVGHESLWDIWQQICPDPNLILRLPAGAFGPDREI